MVRKSGLIVLSKYYMVFKKLDRRKFHSEGSVPLLKNESNRTAQPLKCGRWDPGTQVKCTFPLGQNYYAVHFVNKQLQKGIFFLAKLKWETDVVLL